MLNCTESEPSTEQLLRIPYQSAVDEKVRDFFLYLPKGYTDDPEKTWPVLMFLHGDGERGNGKDELDYVMVHGPLYESWVQKRDLPFILIVPQLHMFGRDTIGIPYLAERNPDAIPERLVEGVPQREPDNDPQGAMTGAIPADTFAMIGPPNGWDKCEADLVHMLNLVKEQYQVNERKIYLSGLSYGGFGTWYLASKHPEFFAAINPIVGWGLPDLMEPIAQAKLPIWTFCGGRDPVVQTQYFFAGLNKLEDLGHKNIRFTIHEDMSHDVWKRVYSGNDLYDWLLSYEKE